MFLWICDNTFCSANVDSVVNALLTLTVIFLVLKRLESISCYRWGDREAGDMGRECPCSPKSSAPGALVPPASSLGSDSEVRESKLPDWWQLKAWALEKLPDISRPLNPSQILSPRPQLKFKETETHVAADVVPCFEIGSGSNSGQFLPHDAEVLERRSAADSNSDGMFRQGRPSRDGRGWLVRKKRGWLRSKKKRDFPSVSAVTKARSSGAASPVDASASKKSPVFVNGKWRLEPPPPAAKSSAARIGKGFPSSPAGSVGKAKSAQTRWASPSTTSTAREKSEASLSSTSASLTESCPSDLRASKHLGFSASGPSANSAGRKLRGKDALDPSASCRTRTQIGTVEYSSSGYSSPLSASEDLPDLTHPSTSASISPRVALGSREIDVFQHSDSFRPSTTRPLKQLHVVLDASTCSTPIVLNQEASSSAGGVRMSDVLCTSSDSGALESYFPKLSTPSTSEEFYSLSTSDSFASSKIAGTVEPSLQSGTTSPAQSYAKSRNHQGPSPASSDAGGITEERQRRTEAPSCSPRSFTDPDAHFHPLPSSRSRRGSDLLSSEFCTYPGDSSRETLEPSDPDSPSPRPYPCRQPTPNSQHEHDNIRMQSPRCQVLPVHHSGTTSSSVLPSANDPPSYDSKFTTSSVCSHARYAHDASVDKKLLISNTDFVGEGLVEASSEKERQNSSLESRASYATRSARTSLTRVRGVRPSANIGSSGRTLENPPARMKNVWEPGAWPNAGQPRDGEGDERSVNKRKSRRSSALEGLTRLATASKENRGRKLGQRKVSFNEEGQNKLSFRRSLLAEERPTGAQARRSPMEYVGKVPRNSPAELSPMGSCQVSPRLASPGGLQTTSPASAPFPVHQGQAFNPAIPMIATPFVSGLPTLYQRSSIPVGNGGSMKPMRLDYQGYPIPAYKAVLPGISSQYLDYRGCTGAPCLEFHQLHAACFGKFAGCPVAHLVDQQVFGVDPSAQSRVRPEAYFPNYRGYPSLSYQCYQGYSAAPGMTQSGTPCFQAPLAASSTKPQAYLAPSQRTFQALPETSSTRNRGVTGASSTTKQVQLPAVPPSYIDDPTFASSNRRSSIHSRKKGHEDLSAPDSRNPKNQNPPPRPNKDYYPNLSCKTGIQLGGKRLVKRPLEAQDSRATATSPDDTLNVKVKTPPSLVETDANNVEVTSRGPGGGHICTPPPSHSELEQKSASQFHPIPGDVVILFSGLLASADREATFVYFHPNQSASEPEPRKGNMAVTGENDQRAMLIRYGEFDRNGIWTPNIQIKLFYTGSDDIWRLVTKTFVTNLPWLHRSKRSCARLRMPDPHFKPRSGDLIVRTAMPRSAARELEEAQDHQAGDAEWVLIWWDHNHLVITDDMIVRAYVGPAPKRNNQPSYSLLGRVEMYTKKDVNYLFMGRDQHTFSESTLNRRRCSSQRLCGMLHTQFCCS